MYDREIEDLENRLENEEKKTRIARRIFDEQAARERMENDAANLALKTIQTKIAAEDAVKNQKLRDKIREEEMLYTAEIREAIKVRELEHERARLDYARVSKERDEIDLMKKKEDFKKSIVQTVGAVTAVAVVVSGIIYGRR